MGPFFSKNSRSIAASTPADTRIYAVGDIHGRADLLIETIARIDEDRARRPIGASIEVYLGDYIDRGPDSKTVIDLLSRRLVSHVLQDSLKELIFPYTPTDPLREGPGEKPNAHEFQSSDQQPA